MWKRVKQFSFSPSGFAFFLLVASWDRMELPRRQDRWPCFHFSTHKLRLRFIMLQLQYLQVQVGVLRFFCVRVMLSRMKIEDNFDTDM